MVHIRFSAIKLIVWNVFLGGGCSSKFLNTIKEHIGMQKPHIFTSS